VDQIIVLRNTDIATIVRVTIALLLEGAVGFERERVGQAAGLRTHMLVSAGAACFSIASIYGFDTLPKEADVARVAANIVSGIGFLGAAAIFRNGPSVRGLTTAAGIWITAAIGMLAGLGLMVLAVYTTVLVWFVLFVLKALPFRGNMRAADHKGEPSISRPPGQEEPD
jgi:putative Mg2+ transporter-C (MgtC) family protein